MFDSHCHLQDERIFDSVYDLISRARAVGVGGFLCCGTSPSDWNRVARIGSAYEGVVCAFGVHPWNADSVVDKWEDLLRKYLRGDKRAVVGEIGLDSSSVTRRSGKQADVFIRQLYIASDFARPVSIHCRDSWGALVGILSRIGGLRYGGAIHSYSGSAETVVQLQKFGCYISFSGAILNESNKKAERAIREVLPRYLLVETDSPDMLPLNSSGDFNEPSNLPLIINKIADVTGMEPDEVSRLTSDNARRLFNIK